MLAIATYILTVAMTALCVIIYLQYKELKRIQDKFDQIRKNDASN